MNREQMQALGRVLKHFGHDEVRQYQEAGNSPPGHIAEALLFLDNYRQARSLEMDDERKGRVLRDDDADDPTTANALGITISHDSALSTQGRIAWSLLSLAGLPLSLENFVRDALITENSELSAPTIAALETIRQKRNPDLDAEIPF